MCNASPNRRADTIGAGSSGSRSDAMNRSKLTLALGTLASALKFIGHPTHQICTIIAHGMRLRLGTNFELGAELP
ncbi:hypothetical protein BURKHO8Y_50009 [Burkholderia sp. 8Y]|nr:hypothetical protein BURKHO8Y_50009 [Burkholderia sp. 8Y]